jgi:hypothetical protein
VLDLTASLRLRFAEQAALRVDAGFHDMFYVGTAVGPVF